MLNTTKLYSVFDPLTITEDLHIIGCGAIGSNLAVMLIRQGVDHITLWDYDDVVPHNITNQAFRQCDIGKTKTEALSEILKEINSDVQITIKGKYETQPISGYIFLAVDDIRPRQNIVQRQKYNPNIKAMFDFRMGLYDAQHYATLWKQPDIDNFYATMNFTQEEAMANVPMSPCGTTLSVLPTVESIVALGVSNFMQLINGSKQLQPFVIINTLQMEVVTAL